MSLTLLHRSSRVLLSIGAISLAMLVAACGSSSSGTTGNAGSSLTSCHVTASDLTLPGGGASGVATPTPGLSGQNLSLDGSSALQPLLKVAGQEFDSANGTHTSANAGGSGTGLKDVQAGAVQIGMSDIFYQDSATTQGFTDLVDHRVAVVAFTLVVSSDLQTKVQNLSTQQIKDIYAGTDTNWSQVGGPNENITVVNRPVGSGTRATFEKYVLGGATNEIPGTTLSADSTGLLATTISTTPGAIGYAATGFVLNPQYSSSIFPICIDGAKPTTTDINSGKYKDWNYEHAYTKGQPTPLEQSFFDFVNSASFQTNELAKQGFLQVNTLTSAATATHPLPAGAQ